MAAPSCEAGNGGTPAPVAAIAVRYCLVSGIPAVLRSAQLRVYFSQLVETGAFLCFHYRHRPERPPAGGGGEAAAPRTCSCLVALQPGRARRFVRMYSGKRWLGPGGASLPGRCLIRRVRLGSGPGTDTFPASRDKTASGDSITEADLKRLPEFNPPSFMPYGNVGTPLKVFLELIRACRLPPWIIKKLQLDFPKTGSSRRYGNVPFEYQHTETVTEERVYTATGEEITEEEEPVARAEVTQPAGAEEDEEEQEEEEEESHDDDNDTCEEWERHEALHEDVTKQERTEERLFEEGIELKWEKGGSGLVFYTDAQYWQEENGDFDEQTVDDWDVDMSIYYDKEGGDKDARDSVQLRLEQRLREGLEHGAASGHQIGTFERHTKGFGRKVLEQQGWTEGLGLGSRHSGMAQALDNEGQNPRCKRGLGYHGEKLPTFSKVKKPRQDSPILISTIYDDPDPKDSGDQLLRRQPPTAMKYRQDMAFVRASHGALESFRTQSC